MSSRPRLVHDPLPSLALHERAADNLRYIRETMERATSFTAVSGAGYVLVGVTALVAAAVASVQSSNEAWLAVWVSELLFAGVLLVWMTARKARSQGVPLRSHTGRKLLLAFAPPMVVGAVLTAATVSAENYGLLPGIWLSLYGAGVMTGGAWSVRVIPIMGSIFVGLGSVALLVAVPADLVLGLGLGVLHVVFGAIVWRWYGG